MSAVVITIGVIIPMMVIVASIFGATSHLMTASRLSGRTDIATVGRKKI